MFHVAHYMLTLENVVLTSFRVTMTPRVSEASKVRCPLTTKGQLPLLVKGMPFGQSQPSMKLINVLSKSFGRPKNALKP
jgi:hypothetical protein